MHIPPIVFADGTEFYAKLASTYKAHSKGLFILAPSGAGKTHFCKNQALNNWIDGDAIWVGGKAHPNGPWWKESIDVINRIDMRCDILTMEAMERGFWIMGASNYWLRPSAIVIPEWETHKKYIKHRETTHYDGGAKSEDLDQVQGHITAIKRWHTEKGVPMFQTIEDAVTALTKELID